METYYIFATLKGRKNTVLLGEYIDSWSGPCMDRAYDDARKQGLDVVSWWYVRVCSVTEHLLTEEETKAVEKGAVLNDQTA